MTRWRRGAADTGSATMWLVSMVAILGVVTLVLAQVGAALVERLEAQSAADLAALAGAGALQRGDGACAEAAAIAEDNGVEMVDCVVTGPRVTLRVRAVAELPVLGRLPVTARARAGPGQASPG